MEREKEGDKGIEFERGTERDRVRKRERKG